MSEERLDTTAYEAAIDIIQYAHAIATTPSGTRYLLGLACTMMEDYESTTASAHGEDPFQNLLGRT